MGNAAQSLDEKKIGNSEDHGGEPITFMDGIETGEVRVVNGEVWAEVDAAEKWSYYADESGNGLGALCGSGTNHQKWLTKDHELPKGPEM